MKKNIIITGASGNLGKACVSRYAADGYRVIGTVSPGKTLGYHVPGDIESFPVDLTNGQNVSEMVTSIISKYQTIDAALLLAGGFMAGGINETDGDSLKKMYSLNFETAYFMARPVFMQMQRQPSGGRIILVGSRPSLNADEGKNLIAYSLSKSLLFNLADLLNAEGAPQNVITSVVVPSVIDTPDNRKSNPSANFSDWVKPEKVAERMAFITSRNGRSLQDTIIKVYGGP